MNIKKIPLWFKVALVLSVLFAVIPFVFHTVFTFKIENFMEARHISGNNYDLSNPGDFELSKKYYGWQSRSLIFPLRPFILLTPPNCYGVGGGLDSWGWGVQPTCKNIELVTDVGVGAIISVIFYFIISFLVAQGYKTFKAH